MKLTYIYAHVSPIENEIFYIGKADDPWDRLKEHQVSAKTKTHYQANKLRKLAAQGLEPRVEIIAEVPVEEWEFWEKHYIKYFRDLGFRLTNATDGGDGASWPGELNPMFGKFGEEHPAFGTRRTPEACASISARLIGVPKSAEHRKALSAAITGKKFPPRSPEWCAALSASMTGDKHPMFNRKHSPATREKMSKAHEGRTYPSGEEHPAFGTKRTPEQLEKMRKPRSVESKENMRRAQQARRAKEIEL